MPVPKFGWVVLALVAVLRAVGWARTRDSQNGNAPAASETGKTVHETAQDNKPSKNEVNEDGPDLEVKELRFDELEARLPTMEPGRNETTSPEYWPMRLAALRSPSDC